MSEHLGYEKHHPDGRYKANSRNGTRAKKVLTDVGPVDTEVPRDRDGTFEPQLVKKRQRRLSGVDEMVISLTAKGLAVADARDRDEPSGLHGGLLTCEWSGCSHLTA
jgi:transposase-like protein